MCDLQHSFMGSYAVLYVTSFYYDCHYDSMLYDNYVKCFDLFITLIGSLLIKNTRVPSHFISTFLCMSHTLFKCFLINTRRPPPPH